MPVNGEKAYNIYMSLPEEDKKDAAKIIQAFTRAFEKEDTVEKQTEEPRTKTQSNIRIEELTCMPEELSLAFKRRKLIIESGEIFARQILEFVKLQSKLVKHLQRRGLWQELQSIMRTLSEFSTNALENLSETYRVGISGIDLDAQMLRLISLNRPVISVKKTVSRTDSSDATLVSSTTREQLQKTKRQKNEQRDNKISTRNYSRSSSYQGCR